jgi:ABC-type antimicrobial peptide transport system permease subunit
VGLALALLGVYGVLAYAVGRRTQEIGIRGALGASRADLSRMVVIDGIRLAAIGAAIGLPLAALAARSLGEILHGTSPTDPVVLAAVAVGVTASPPRRGPRCKPAPNQSHSCLRGPLQQVAAAASWFPA